MKNYIHPNLVFFQLDEGNIITTSVGIMDELNEENIDKIDFSTWE